MEKIIFIIIILVNLSCTGQAPKTEQIFLSVSPILDVEDELNQEIIASLESFLKTKNDSPTENSFWKSSDFEKYTYPYFDIYNIEKSKHGDDFFKPLLMEIISTDEENKKLIKLGFIGHVFETGENSVRCIYNILATKTDTGVVFERAIEYLTKNWKQVKRGSILYKISNRKIPNLQEIEQQEKEIEQLSQFLDTTPFEFIYYSCTTPKESFEIKGFDYLPNMYFSSKGGTAEHGKFIFSGNSSEIYTHEIVHIYTHHLFPRMNRFLDEGLATYIGGSGANSYKWHRAKMKEYLIKNEIKFDKHLEPYERFYIEDETPIPYMIGAIICERINRKFGKEKLFELFRSQKSFWEIMETVGVTKDNFNQEILSELSLPKVWSWRNEK